MKYMIKKQRRGKKDIPALEDKPLRKYYEENDKKKVWGVSVEEREQKAFWKVE